MLRKAAAFFARESETRLVGEGQPPCLADVPAPQSTNRITTTEGDCTRTDEKMIFIEEQAKAA